MTVHYPDLSYEDGDEDFYIGNPDREESIEWSLHKLLLDPIAWQAVGKVEGWQQDTEERRQGIGLIVNKGRWYYEMHRMIDALAEGKTIEQYLEML